MLYKKMDAKKINILIVEDSPTQAEQLRYLLENNDYTVTSVLNGKLAVEALREQVPDIVLTDIVMPEMNGYELCKYIKDDKKLKHIPVILLTHLSDPSDIIKGLQCGADNFITKPYEENYLLTRIMYVHLNKQLLQSDKTEIGIEIFFSNEKYLINSERLQILNLLLSTFEIAIQKNSELIKTQNELRMLNNSLEMKVNEKTIKLMTEIEERKIIEEDICKLNDELEQRVLDRTAELNGKNAELERFNKLFVGRELKMVELKKQIAELEAVIESIKGDGK